MQSVLQSGWEDPARTMHFDSLLNQVFLSRQPTPANDQKLMQVLERVNHLVRAPLRARGAARSTVWRGREHRGRLNAGGLGRRQVKSNLDGVTVMPFGSFASGVHSLGSDLDISLEVSPASKWAYQPDGPVQATPPGLRGKQGAKSLRKLKDLEGAERKKAKVRVLQRMVRVLHGAGMQHVQLIPRANVPLIKFVEPHSGVQVQHAPSPRARVSGLCQLQGRGAWKRALSRWQF